jgi:hypothetical protein
LVVEKLLVVVLELKELVEGMVVFSLLEDWVELGDGVDHGLRVVVERGDEVVVFVS